MNQKPNTSTPSCSGKDQEALRDKELDACFYAGNAASAKDCTGSVVRGPQSDGVGEAYNQVYHHKPKAADVERLHHKE